MQFSSGKGDALIIVDVQNDFLPGGTLAVSESNKILSVINKYIFLFSESSALIVATRDWHPENHCSFVEQGGEWPLHCVAGSSGAKFSVDLDIPCSAAIISKAETSDKDAYSGFENTRLVDLLKEQQITRIFVCGLATDFCVLYTVIDGLRLGFEVVVLMDAVKAVNVEPGDGEKAIQKMLAAGAQAARMQDVQ